MSFVRTGAVVAGVALAGLAATPAFATGNHGSPNGNNGTVKIENIELDDDGTPENNPHQDCTFNVEWFGYDAGDDIISKVTFELHAPTNTESHVLSVFDGDMTPVVGKDEVKLENDAASGAGNDKDGSKTYTLHSTGEPNANQGYHVKVTVETPHSKGNDTKTKVFWFQNCDTEEPSPTPSPSAPVGEEPSEEPSENPSEQPSDEPSEEPSEATPVADESEPADDESSAAPVAGDEDSEVPTNIDAGLAGESDSAVPAMWPLLAMLAGAAAAGTALVVVLRRRATALVRKD
ncbi:hypothetical protein WBG06_10015 [Nocardioides sp. CCNWLW239]|uniref:hypothetical protein n=1 Tax=Nocardioides sp. CCNWLW239 TaxID=3128902 RepID=UPI003015A210